MKTNWIVAALLFVPLHLLADARPAAEPTLSLQESVTTALQTDPWLNASSYRETALLDRATASSTLPDPKVTLMAGNFPTDTFSIHQEGMTQLAVGVSQMFPRGDSRALASQRMQTLAGQEPLLRLDRQAAVTNKVTVLWLEVYRAQHTIAIINRDRSLFDHLVDAAKTNYTSAAGGARQQDLIRAQLEITRLEDRLTLLEQQKLSNQQRLSEWIGSRALVTVGSQLPSQEGGLVGNKDQLHDKQWLYQQISQHPLMLAFEQRISAQNTGVMLAKQKYKPEWGLSAQYGYRDSDPMGNDRADLLTVGVSFDLPIFTGSRQDKEVSAETAQREALKTEKQLLARNLMAQLESTLVTLEQLERRKALYQKDLLPQMSEQADAALLAYNNADGDFAEAVRSRIAELNSHIDYLTLQVEEQKLYAQIRYLLVGGANLSEQGNLQ